MKDTYKAKLSLILAMTIFGTIGIFRRYIELSSAMVALVRGVLGVTFLLVFIRVRRISLNKEAIKKELWRLLVSGALIGFNWVLLFESYRYTSVAVSTLCYYMAPIIVMLVAPFILKEKLTVKKCICVAFALVGMVFVSGILDGTVTGSSQGKGIAFGLGAAFLYASVVILNQGLKQVPTYDKTIIQLGTAAVVLFVYILFTEDITDISINPKGVAMLFVVGIVHTGIAYALYFSSMNVLKAQTVALYSYIDPIIAIILSSILLGEAMTIYGVIGAVLIIGSTLTNELVGENHTGKRKER